MKKTILLSTLSVFIAVCALNVFSAPVEKSVSATAQPVSIDMYLIGGQSNAAGYSAKGDLNETFTNVGYAGAVNHYLSSDVYEAENLSFFSKFKWQVTTGLGHNSGYIGPEYGMAKIFNGIYSGSKKAFIFKSAAGGTALRDVTGNENDMYGNWYPRSLWTNGYVPSIGIASDPTGVQYELFVENFRKVYLELVANGYAPIIKGMVWMQGCSDLGHADEYKELLKTFIADIRKDLSDITDTDLSAMPFIIGKIATTFGSYNNGQVPSFNAAQQNVADSMVNVETIETSDLIIVREDGTVNGTDKYHFGTADAVTLGTRFAQKLLEVNMTKNVDVETKNGQVLYEVDDGDLTLTFVPKDDGYVLTDLKIDGEDINLDSVVDNTYVIRNADKSSYLVEAEFSVNFQTFKITYEPLYNKGTYAANADGTRYPASIREGSALTVTVIPSEGYKVASVLFNDEQMESIGNDRYRITPKESGSVKVVFSYANAATDDNPDNGAASSGGCGGEITLSGGNAALLMMILSAVLCLKKRGAAR